MKSELNAHLDNLRDQISDESSRETQSSGNRVAPKVEAQSDAQIDEELPQKPAKVRGINETQGQTEGGITNAPSIVELKALISKDPDEEWARACLGIEMPLSDPAFLEGLNEVYEFRSEGFDASSLETLDSTQRWIELTQAYEFLASLYAQHADVHEQ